MVPKPKLDPETEEGYRDVTLTSEPAKGWHKILRYNVFPAAEKVAPPGVVGSGIRKGGTAHARVGLGAVVGIARKAKKCSGHVFVDVKSAFTSFVRAAVFGGEDEFGVAW